MTAFLAAAVVIAAVAAWTDWTTGHIPNWITYGTFGLSPVAHIVASLLHHETKVDSLIAGSYSVLGAVVCALLPLMLYRRNAIGGGDVKLFIALGAMLRPLVGGEVEIWSFVAAGLIAPFVLAYHGKLFKTLRNAVFLVVNPLLAKDKQREIAPQELSWFRLGPAIFVASAYVAAEHWKDALGGGP